MIELKNKLINILEESKLINLFDENYIKEDSNGDDEFSYKYFVNMRDKVNNPLHISSFEIYTRKRAYKDGSFLKFRIYHDNKMPIKVHNQLERINFRISNAKSYIDFASDNIENLVYVSRCIYDILYENMNYFNNREI